MVNGKICKSKSVNCATQYIQLNCVNYLDYLELNIMFTRLLSILRIIEFSIILNNSHNSIVNQIQHKSLQSKKRDIR